ncbi:MAG: ISAzo13-like element transposase-related protein [Methylocella sp.]
MHSRSSRGFSAARTTGAVSVDTKKKERVGDFKNGGREWRPKGDPEPVRVYDFIDRALGKVNPCGVYDPAANGQVGSGSGSIMIRLNLQWKRYGGGGRKWDATSATELLVTADGGGSNGARVRL